MSDDDHDGRARRASQASTSIPVSPETQRRSIKRVTVDDEEYDRFLKWLRAERMKDTRTLSKSNLMDILTLHVSLRHDAYVNSKKSGRQKPMDFVKTTSQLLRRDYNVCHSTWKDYVNKKEISAAVEQEGARGKKYTTFPRTQSLSFLLRDWLHERELNRQRTVAKDVMFYLIEQGILPANTTSEPKKLKAGLRAVQRYILHLGFHRGRRKGQLTYVQKAAIIVQRDAYVTKMKEVQNHQRIVYMDESYIHQNYSSHEDSLFDSLDSRAVPNDKKKGPRYCFIGAIISSDPTVSREDMTPSSQAQFLPETLRIFTPKKGEVKKPTADYHGMFNHQYFRKWMQDLIDALQIRGIKNTVIIMDNAKYHKTLPEGTPKSFWKRSQIIEYCSANFLPIEERETKAMIWNRLKVIIQNNIKPEIVKMAEDAGTLHYYSAYLQLISVY